MMRSYFLMIICFLCFACGDNQAKNITAAAPPPKYYYYPKANVYFDTVNKNYVFLGSDGATWTSGKEIPAAMQTMMDKSVLLDTFSQPVWKDNQNHRLIYSAVLYRSPQDTIEKKPEPVVQKPTVITDSSEKKKEKKGLRKFLDKIFGKKKKDKETDSN